MQDIFALFKPLANPERITTRVLYIIGMLLSPITMAGMLWFYIRSYRRFLRDRGRYPLLSDLEPISKAAMILGGLVIWFIILIILSLLFILATVLFNEGMNAVPIPLLFLLVNLLISYLIFRWFRRWQKRVSYILDHEGRFGSASWATEEQKAELERKQGLYIGGGIYAYPNQGHLLLIAGTRSGKMTDVLAPNLLGLSGLQGSHVVVDIKQELTCITSRFLETSGRRVLILSPWNAVVKGNANYNPLDLASRETDPDALVDSVAVIAEMVVPKVNSGEAYWSNRARSVVSGVLLHIITGMEKSQHTLGTLWKLLRLPEEQWNELLADMGTSDNEVVRSIANEILNLSTTSGKTWASIISHALDATDFLKSKRLRKSLESSTFDINTINDGKTALYIVIPPEQLEANSKWLRLVITTSMLSVVKNRNQRTNFIIDECATLGYLPILKTALSTFAGYGVSLWSVFQNIDQIKAIYGEEWGTFFNNSAVKLMFGVRDVTTAEYMSKLMGDKTVITYEERGKINATARPLATPDEIRRGSENNIFAFVDGKPPMYLQKVPYYKMPSLDGLHDPNPYYNPEVTGKADSREEQYKEQLEKLRRQIYGMDL